ncbi:polysaccharide biosynthesis C-terminal domain-containing protein [Conexibacter sp. JD483]|uniref:oligosaccharide flippase family protein n=1 Tax=unclassified Conexibacter TaxID=2627773 RepID=UPI002727DABC|nr:MULTISPECIES: polysaccharide biosynthesis C-terminal domain-containing protein [unclassified Conexibacter]MDO8184062.1 polysaccharide biosynthesis C-terminal domain-containing protein [Conexibacter sp. CPCC 205706]MDO8197054.1 polysaccharide biosynthesis C-terminal domain-containing protein [Conexibacter sp. CPCC 205762]MDR9367970.1 polysaccharide biosynthesis C-terminal domain-containing protein [Conexibacter sp. JD483]
MTARDEPAVEPDAPDAAAEPPTRQSVDEALTAPDAGNRAIRGGVIRVVGFGAGLFLTALVTPFLLRHLGVDAFGQYTAVVAIVTIVQGLTDAGLTIVGQRAYVHADAERRRTLLADLLGIRLVLTPIGILLGVGFAVLAGYPNALVTGTLLAGVGVVLGVTAAALAMPLSVELRLGAVTAIDFVRQLTLVIGIAVLIVAGAGLLPFFGTYIAGGAVAVAAALAFLGTSAWVVPRFSWREWRPLLKESVPVALSLVVNTTYVRALIVLCSLLATEHETGLFAASYRISEILLGVPMMMFGAAFPILAHAHVADRDRLAYALQRMGEASLLVGLLVGLLLAVGAVPAMAVLGGSEFSGAADALRIQSVAIAGAFMTGLGTAALISVHRQRELLLVNLIALLTVIVLGTTLIPLWGANGAALAASIGELLLAVTSLTLLIRSQPDLRPDFHYVPKLLLAAGAGAACLLLPGSDVIATVAAALVYGAVAWLLRAVPMELVDALVRRRPLADA